MDSRSHRELVDHLFRSEYGRMVAVLTRLFGFEQLELVEDVVQDAFVHALRSWRTGVPPNPGGWLMQTARNRAIDQLRRGKLHLKFASTVDPGAAAIGMADLFHESEISDSQLRLIFACCHPVLDERDQIAVTLQLASGFGVREIARALLTREETIKKRLQRSKQRIKEAAVKLEIPAGAQLKSRVDSVLKVLYLTFNEGYLASAGDAAIRRDLCAEAMRLTKLVCEHPMSTSSDANALMALMCYHAARFDARLGDNNELILLADQDRSKWDKELVSVGHVYLARSNPGDNPSAYVLEAAIAAQHSVAEAYGDTRWDYLLTLYDRLVEVKTTAFVRLNRLVVLAEQRGADVALRELASLDAESFVGNEHLYHSVSARLHEMAGDTEGQRSNLEKALSHAASSSERRLIEARLLSIR